MTRSLRRRHLTVWLLVGPVCILVLIAGLVLKPGARAQPTHGAAKGSAP